MTYRCGLGPGLGNRPPHIICDEPSCSAVIVIDGDPPLWFLEGRAKRGWGLRRIETPEGRITRTDYCSAHRHLLKPAPPRGTDGEVDGG